MLKRIVNTLFRTGNATITLDTAYPYLLANKTIPGQIALDLNK